MPLVSRKLVSILIATPLFGLIAPAAASGSTAPKPHDYFAVVQSNGALARGTRGTSVTHPGAGRYDVTFPGSVSGCAAVANLGYAGTAEQFKNITAVTTATSGHTVLVDTTGPGPLKNHYPHDPVLVNQSFHLHVDCFSALFADVTAGGKLSSASPGVTISRRKIGSGAYSLNFHRNIADCAPTATVRAPANRHALAAQAFLALGADSRSVRVSVNYATTKAVDKGFSLIVTCGGSPFGIFPDSGGFYNMLFVPKALSCAFTGSWYDPSPGSAPSDQGYVSTWAFSANTATIQTKNGGYGIAQGFGVDLVATC